MHKQRKHLASLILLVMGVLARVPAASGDETSSLPSWSQPRGESGVDIRVFGERRPGELINRVLLGLQEIGRLDSDFVNVLSKSNVCDVYQKALGLPADMGVCGKSFRVLAQRLNPNLNIDRVPENTYIEVPAIRVCLPSDRGETKADKQNAAPEFRLHVPMLPKAAVKFRARKEWLEERNITIDGWGKAAAAPLPSHAIEVNEYLNLPPDQQCAEHKEADLVKMVSKSNRPLAQRCRVQGLTRMDIIDHSRYASHPDFQPSWKGKEKCLLRNPTNDDHVSGLLGIIRAQANGRGVLGLYPGVQPKVWWWDGERSQEGALTGSEIYDKLNKQPNTNLNVTVVASEWRPEEEQALSRFVINGAGSEIASMPDDSRLWVVSAGHAPNVGRRELLAGGLEWPQVRGQQSNVLVVTGCDNCMDIENARVPDDFRYNDSLVHVAAAAVNVPTTMTTNGYGRMQGTSPATAFVAAIATVLADCYPQLRASNIKERLQFTSRPLLLMQDAEKLAAGVVDPDIALLTPNEVHLKLASGGNPAAFKNVEVEGWCVGDFAVLDPETGQKLGDNWLIDTVKIERIYRVSSETKTSWVFYRSAHKGPNRELGRVVRIGPGTRGPVFGDSLGANNEKELLKLKDGTVLSLNEIADIVGKPEISSEVLSADACKKNY